MKRKTLKQVSQELFLYALALSFLLFLFLFFDLKSVKYLLTWKLLFFPIVSFPLVIIFVLLLLSFYVYNISLKDKGTLLVWVEKGALMGRSSKKDKVRMLTFMIIALIFFVPILSEMGAHSQGLTVQPFKFNPPTSVVNSIIFILLLFVSYYSLFEIGPYLGVSIYTKGVRAGTNFFPWDSFSGFVKKKDNTLVLLPKIGTLQKIFGSNNIPILIPDKDGKIKEIIQPYLPEREVDKKMKL